MLNNIQTIIDKLDKQFYDDSPLADKSAKEWFKKFIKDSLTSMLDEIIEDGPQRMEHEDNETKEWGEIVSEHNGCVYDFHKIINSHY